MKETPQLAKEEIGRHSINKLVVFDVEGVLILKRCYLLFETVKKLGLWSFIKIIVAGTIYEIGLLPSESTRATAPIFFALGIVFSLVLFPGSASYASIAILTLGDGFARAQPIYTSSLRTGAHVGSLKWSEKSNFGGRAPCAIKLKDCAASYKYRHVKNDEAYPCCLRGAFSACRN